MRAVAFEGRWVRLGCGALIALWAATLATPGTARAGCAHYVVSGARSLDEATRWELLLVSGQVVPTSAAMPAGLPARRSPCPGGICSRGPELPLAPAPSAPWSIEHWGCLLDDSLADDPDRPEWLVEPPAHPPLPPAQDLDRPPRASISL